MYGPTNGLGLTCYLKDLIDYVVNGSRLVSWGFKTRLTFIKDCSLSQKRVWARV